MSRIHSGPIAVRALEIFDVSARLGSFTAAGAELGITQSAVSRQIADLEARLDVQLFARSGPNLSLTPKGRELAAGVGQGFQQIATSLAKIRTPTEHIVTLSMLPSVAAKWSQRDLAGKGRGFSGVYAGICRAKQPCCAAGFGGRHFAAYGYFG